MAIGGDFVLAGDARHRGRPGPPDSRRLPIVRPRRPWSRTARCCHPGAPL